MNIEVTFIYQPKSGDRVFVEHLHTAEFVVLRWPNGCRHVVGGVHLWWRSRSRAWRASARTIITSYVEAVNGIAWDAQGELHVVVPARHAWALHKWLSATLARLDGCSSEETREIEALLISRGLARFTWHMNEGLEATEASAPQAPDLSVVHLEQTSGETPQMLVLVCYGESGRNKRLVMAPAAWGYPSWQDRGRIVRGCEFAAELRRTKEATDRASRLWTAPESSSGDTALVPATNDSSHGTRFAVTRTATIHDSEGKLLLEAYGRKMDDDGELYGDELRLATLRPDMLEMAPDGSEWATLHDDDRCLLRVGDAEQVRGLAGADFDRGITTHG